MGATNAWQSFDGAVFGALAQGLSSDSDGGAPGRTQLASFIEGRYLTNGTAVKELDLPTWNILARSLGGGLSAPSKMLWITQIRGTYAEAAAFARHQRAAYPGSGDQPGRAG